MGLVGRLVEWRKRTFLRKKVGPDWEQFYYENNRWPSDAIKLQPDGSLTVPEYGYTIPKGSKAGKTLLLAEYLWGPMRNKAGVNFSLQGDLIIAETKGLRMGLGKIGDMATLREVFIDQLYNYDIADSEHLMVDIGANIGLATLYLARQNPGPIHSFELVPSTAALAQANFDLNPQYAPRIKFHQYGLGDKDASFELTIDPDNTAGNSMFRSKGDKVERVEVRDAATVLQEVLDSSPIRPLVVKLDAEGAEYGICRRWHQAGLMKEIDVLMMESHAQEGESMEEIRGILRENGFKWFEQQAWETPHGFLYAFGKKI